MWLTSLLTECYYRDILIIDETGDFHITSCVIKCRLGTHVFLNRQSLFEMAQKFIIVHLVKNIYAMSKALSNNLGFGD